MEITFFLVGSIFVFQGFFHGWTVGISVFQPEALKTLLETGALSGVPEGDEEGILGESLPKVPRRS